jgi:hypothetical protein
MDAARRKLIGTGQDLSELIQGLLELWLKKRRSVAAAVTSEEVVRRTVLAAEESSATISDVTSDARIRCNIQFLAAWARKVARDVDNRFPNTSHLDRSKRGKRRS